MTPGHKRIEALNSLRGYCANVVQVKQNVEGSENVDSIAEIYECGRCAHRDSPAKLERIGSPEYTRMQVVQSALQPLNWEDRQQIMIHHSNTRTNELAMRADPLFGGHNRSVPDPHSCSNRARIPYTSTLSNAGTTLVKPSSFELS